MGNVEQLLDPLDYIKFFKNIRLFEKDLAKRQNLTLYTIYGKLSQFMENFSLTNACITTVSNLDIVLKN